MASTSKVLLNWTFLSAAIRQLPTHSDFWKLPQVSFLAALCEELCRMDAVRKDQLVLQFTALDSENSGSAPVAAVQRFLRTACSEVFVENQADVTEALVQEFIQSAAAVSSESAAPESCITLEGFMAAAEDSEVRKNLRVGGWASWVPMEMRSTMWDIERSNGLNGFSFSLPWIQLGPRKMLTAELQFADLDLQY